MGEIIGIDDRRPHETHELICINCMGRWQGVWPSSLLLKDIDCPYCQYHGAVIKTGQAQ